MASRSKGEPMSLASLNNFVRKAEIERLRERVGRDPRGSIECPLPYNGDMEYTKQLLTRNAATEKEAAADRLAARIARREATNE